MLQKIKVEDAIGTVLAHDITEIRAKREFKGRAFKKGHLVTQNDVAKLLDLGKEHLYVLRIADDEVHENEAGEIIAKAIAGRGVYLSDEVKEGRVNLFASYAGLLKIHIHALEQLNLLGEVMCATRHNNSLVKRAELLAGTRVIPLLVNRALVQEAVDVTARFGKIVEVLPLRSVKVGLLITGNEIHKERIKDAFEPIIRKKISAVGSQVIAVRVSPDDEGSIGKGIEELIAGGAQLIVTTGGMSVDPDDVTPQGIRRVGAHVIAHGAAVLPGAMFLVAYLDDIPILGLPACGMYHNQTIFDLILPRILAGEKIGRAEIAKLGHGGLCLDCADCVYPRCSFGKGS